MHTLSPRVLYGALAGAIVAGLIRLLANVANIDVDGEQAQALVDALTTAIEVGAGFAVYAYTHRKKSAKLNPPDAATTPVAEAVARVAPAARP